MIRHSPSEFYLKYLLTHQDAYTKDEVIERGTALGLDCLGRWYLNKLENLMDPPLPFYPNDRCHLPSREFLRKERIEAIYAGGPDIQQALLLLHNARPREMAEVMWISGAPDTAIQYGLHKRFGFEISVHGLQLYRHYFWKIELLDTTEMRAITLRRLESNVTSVISEDSEVQNQFTTLSKLKHSDPRVVASRNPSSPISALIAQVELGVMPKGIKLATVLEQGRLLNALRALEAASIGGPAGADMAAKYAITAKTLGDLLETVLRPEDVLRDELATFKLKTSQQRVPLLMELSNGNHTQELHAADKHESEEVRDDGDGEAFNPETDPGYVEDGEREEYE